MPNPLVQQGLLNRILTSVVVAGFPQLSVTASNMTKSLASLEFDDDGVDQIGTATGIVNSPKPYVMATVMLNILRSQTVAAAYLAQWQLNAFLGTVNVFSDSTTFPAISLAQCSIMRPDPGTFDGQDPTVKVTLKGIYYINSSLWTG